jgi:putative tricarboxylic transport membrane protein
MLIIASPFSEKIKRARQLMKKAEKITGIILWIMSGYIIWESWQMPDSATFGPGAAFLPLCLGIILAVLATILFSSASMRQATEQDKKSVLPEKKKLLIVSSVMAGLVGYILLIDVFGYLATTFLFVVYLMKVSEREPWPLTLKVSIATTFGLFILFQYVLKITLPSNMFGF